MIFVLIYNRDEQGLCSVHAYSDNQRTEARDNYTRVSGAAARRGHAFLLFEVALLEAESWAALIRTHPHYFKTASELASDLYDALERAAKGNL